MLAMNGSDYIRQIRRVYEKNGHTEKPDLFIGYDAVLP